MIRVQRLAPALILALVLTPSLARSEWEPLAIGNRWEYRGTGGSHQVEHIAGTFPLRGRVVAIKSYTEGADAGLENYWLLDADGSVLLAGFTSPDGMAVAYEPPIRYLDTPPAVGAKPTQLVTAYDLHTNAVMFTDYFRYDITEDVVLSLPAGALPALGVGRIEATGPALATRRTLDGRTLPEPARRRRRTIRPTGIRTAWASCSTTPPTSTSWSASASRRPCSPRAGARSSGSTVS